MSTLQNKYDAVEQLIFIEGLKIKAVTFHKELDIMLVILNTKAVLRQKISTYANLSKANEVELNTYILLADGIGVHWPLLDEDLSLKGFLQNELRNVVTLDSAIA
jgi:hypothetical protein